jgi:rod shape determining protein RodA
MSYGGSSLLTFTFLIFILIKLDTDRQMVLR